MMSLDWFCTVPALMLMSMIVCNTDGRELVKPDQAVDLNFSSISERQRGKLANELSRGTRIGGYGCAPTAR
jgi:hypothetical protein